MARAAASNILDAESGCFLPSIARHELFATIPVPAFKDDMENGETKKLSIRVCTRSVSVFWDLGSP